MEKILGNPPKTLWVDGINFKIEEELIAEAKPIPTEGDFYIDGTWKFSPIEYREAFDAVKEALTKLGYLRNDLEKTVHATFQKEDVDNLLAEVGIYNHFEATYCWRARIHGLGASDPDTKIGDCERVFGLGGAVRKRAEEIVTEYSKFSGKFFEIENQEI
jgi:hypothetical protein